MRTSSDWRGRYSSPVCARKASLTARRAFEALGFQVVRRETVSVQGQSWVRFQMEKRLP